MLSRAEKLEYIKQGHHIRSEWYVRKEVSLDLKRDPTDIKIFSYPGHYYKAIFLTRFGGFHYDTGSPERYQRAPALRDIIKRRKMSGHQFIPPQEFFENYQKNPASNLFKKAPTVALWAGLYEKALKDSTNKKSETVVPLKIFVETDDKTLPTLDDYAKKEKDCTLIIGCSTFRTRHISQVPHNHIWIFPRPPRKPTRGSMSVWMKMLFSILRGELPQYRPREIWMCFQVSKEDAEPTYRYLMGKQLDDTQIIYCWDGIDRKRYDFPPEETITVTQ